MPLSVPSAAAAAHGRGRARVCIEPVTPLVDGGRFAAKRIAGEEIVVAADVFADGHDRVAAVCRWRRVDDEAWAEVSMVHRGNDRFEGVVVPPTPGRYELVVEGWIDRFETWQTELATRAAAGQPLDVDLRIGAALVRDAAAAASDPERGPEHARDHVWLCELAELLEAPDPRDDPSRRLNTALSDQLSTLVHRHDPRRHASRTDPLPMVVEREKARFSTWYELFPRSLGPEGRHGTLRDVIDRLPGIAAMGFDVLYLPPIHPIGHTHRKGPNDAPVASEGDVGSPWAIGSEDGGHCAIHPELGTLEDFEALRSAAAAVGIELALDIAFQASPDHPWIREHPEWFRFRPDGSIQHAENPPKVYQDIVPLDFESPQWPSLWEALAGVLEHWIDRGVRIFRVDNPHTKSLPFWEWCIDRIRARHPDVVLLSEAFTRPRRMLRLAKVGFSQSYTYFTWRNTAWELRRYFEELYRPPICEFLRANLWPNTPDILPEFLQHGGRPAFAIRLVLAATLGANYGIYGPAFERCEHRARREGSEEYLDSEKYQLRRWDRQASEPGIHELITRINRIRREHPALQQDHDLRFFDADDEQLLCFAKRSPLHEDTIVVVVSLDPHQPRSGWVRIPASELGGREGEPLQVHDLLSEDRFAWSGDAHFVRLDPRAMPAHVFRVRRRRRTERDFDYFA
ncbi:alpha-1,4-glucan--maltose-1-phosphate maltosyltransferase [Paraliomyxa miuraensis]|uniref:alpha-1,4-glucan--maltose-1-phosphate maltosyltransferase n=1 Tax=Paraliomyxa miuraensis TaxID=376150 RepID=UPI002255B0B6|nr:maltotransferase domain-containing protein [Paraliomyxa miuraensis]MCX4241034.1 DUF3416 domain-containing protein [Paraliomyxa miuraensis]